MKKLLNWFLNLFKTKSEAMTPTEINTLITRIETISTSLDTHMNRNNESDYNKKKLGYIKSLIETSLGIANELEVGSNINTKFNKHP